MKYKSGPVATLGRSLMQLVLLLSLCAGGTPVLAAEPLRIASVNFGDRETTINAFTPVVSYLQRQLQRPVELVYLDSNSEVAAALGAGRLDIAMLGPLPYVSLSRQYEFIEPLVFFREASGEARFRCVLVRFSGDDIDLGRLRGRRLALTQPLGTCGYLVTNAVLQAQAGHGLEETDYRYLGNMDNAALAVVAGRADAAGIKDDIAGRYASLGLEVMAESDWVAAIGLFARRSRLDPEQIETIRRVLLATPPEVYRGWEGFMRHGMAAAADHDFDSLRRLGDPDLIPGVAGHGFQPGAGGRGAPQDAVPLDRAPPLESDP